MAISRKIIWKTALGAALASGLGFRFWLYLLNDSFWRDETKLLLNISRYSFLDLLKPLDYGQGAPLAYTWFLRVIWECGGHSAMAMRSLSLVASLIALYLFYFLIISIFSDQKIQFFMVLFFSISPGIILFAGLTKQYSLDVLTAIILLYAFRFLFTANTKNTIPVKNYFLVVAAPLVSLPAIFIVVAIGAALLAQDFKKYFRSALVIMVLGAISFLLEWAFVLNHCASMAALINGPFIEYSSIGGWLWNLKQLFFAYLGPNVTPFLLCGLLFFLILLIVGILQAWRTAGWTCLAILLLPVLLCFAASAIKIFPVFGRSLLFTSPGIYLLAGFGFKQLFQSQRYPMVKIILIFLCLIAPCLHETIRAYTKPIAGVREALQFIAAHRQTGEVVLFDSYAAPTIAYYRLIGSPLVTELTFEQDPERIIEASKTYDENYPERVRSSFYSNKHVWLISETNLYTRGNKATSQFQISFMKFIQHFIGKRQVEHHFYESSMPDQWIPVYNEFASKRHIMNQLVSDRIFLYEFDKENP
jgi:hypothetical protein